MTPKENLAEQSCDNNYSRSSILSEADKNLLLSELDGWSIAIDDEIQKLTKQFKFKNFLQALKFTNDVGAMAELENHHPLISTEWGQVTINWWTHELGGLHKNDFICAAKTNSLYQSE